MTSQENDDILLPDPQVPAPPSQESRVPLISPRGGVRLATRTWAPPKQSKPTALVLIVHGGGWHSGYFDALAKHLSEQCGAYVAAYDQPGAGYSPPDPTAPAGCQHVQSFDEIVDEVFVALAWAQQEAQVVTAEQQVPLYLVGESYGGIIVLAAAMQAKQRNVQLQGAMVLGAALRIAAGIRPPWLVLKFMPLLARVMPRVALPATDFSTTFDEAFGSAKWAQVARRDAKVQVSPQFTVGAAGATFASAAMVQQQASQFPVPLLALHGRHDCRTECEAMQAFVHQVNSTATAATTTAEMCIVETTGHQLLQDTPQVTKQLLSKMAAWLEANIAMASA